MRQDETREDGRHQEIGETSTPTLVSDAPLSSFEMIRSLMVWTTSKVRPWQPGTSSSLTRFGLWALAGVAWSFFRNSNTTHGCCNGFQKCYNVKQWKVMGRILDLLVLPPFVFYYVHHSMKSLFLSFVYSRYKTAACRSCLPSPPQALLWHKDSIPAANNRFECLRERVCRGIISWYRSSWRKHRFPPPQQRKYRGTGQPSRHLSS